MATKLAEEEIAEVKKWLSFLDWQDTYTKELSRTPWLTVYHEASNQADDDGCVYCGLFPLNDQNLAVVLGGTTWNYHSGEGLPTFEFEGRGSTARYERHSRRWDGVPFEPLVYVRTYHGVFPSHLEICEEFRHYRNLFHDRRGDKLKMVTQEGEEEEVGRTTEEDGRRRVEVRTLYLRDFLAAKGYGLAVFFDRWRYYRKDVDFPAGALEGRIQRSDDDFVYEVSIHEDPPGLNSRAMSRLLGKRIIRPLGEPRHPCYLAYTTTDEKKKCESFIIWTDEDGNEILHTSDPEKLTPEPGAAKGARDYLTPVYFKKDVLKKYFDNPSRYTVADGMLHKLGLWGMRYGQNSQRIVHAWLGDLGRDLPHEEQLHWRQFNIPPEGGIGEVTWKRELAAEFANPIEPTLRLKFELERFSRQWQEQFGWDVFLPLRDEDEHVLRAFHVPLTEDPGEFDQQVLYLAKILSDSINVKELRKLCTEPEEEKIKSLERALADHFSIDEDEAKELVEPLWLMQRMRSSASAHRRSKDFQKTARRLGLADSTNEDFVNSLVLGALKLIERMRELVQEHEADAENDGTEDS